MSEIQRKKNERRGHRGSATKMVNQIEPTIAADPLDVAKLEQLKRSINDKIGQLTTLDNDILASTQEGDIDTEIEQADETRAGLYAALAKIDLCLNEHLKARPISADPRPADPPPLIDPTAAVPPPLIDPTAADPPPLVDPSTVDPPPTDPLVDPLTVDPTADPRRDPPIGLPSVPHVTSHLAPHTRVKLPKLTLPHFKGNPIYWTPFWDSYESAIHANPTLSNVDKFNYLRSLLEREAFEAIAGLSLSSANYDQAIAILKKRFGNRQMIVTHHMDLLLHLTPITNDHDVRGLRRLYNEVETNVRSLTALGVKPESYGTMLTSVLLTKLPAEIRLLISRKSPRTELDLLTVLDMFEEELIARERSIGRPRASHDKTREPRAPLSSSLALNTTNPDSKNPPRCCYCQQAHAAESCHVVTQLESRKQSLRSSGRCFNCLAQGHVVRNCRSRPQCTCGRKHHPSVCNSAASNPPEEPVEQTSSNVSHTSTLNPDAAPYVSTTEVSALQSTAGNSILLQTAQAFVYNIRLPENRAKLRILLDGGSQRSYMTERARKLLRLDTEGKQRLSIAAFGSSRGKPQECPIVKVGVIFPRDPTLIMSLFVVPMICEPLVCQPTEICLSQNPEFSKLELAEVTASASRLQVDILVGADNYWEFVTGVVSRGTGGLTAIHTKLGWVLSGPVEVGNKSSQPHTTLVTTHALKVTSVSLEEQLKSFWDLEAMGIQPSATETPYGDSILNFREDTCRYEVSLPWRQFHKPLPSNYQLSYKRLQGLLKRLRQNPELLQSYNRVMLEQIENGIVEDAPLTVSDPTRLHYLPHHAVLRTDKETTKIRVVYDASAKVEGHPSLNDCLLTGPKFNQKILDILIRFRSHKIAVIADIEKAFLMVGVTETDRDALRFLWVEDVEAKEVTVRPLRFTRVVFGVCSSPYLLNYTIRHHLQQYQSSHPELIQKLIESFYVDDVVTGASTEEEAYQLYSESKSILKEGAFNLRKFRTNSPSLQTRIDSGSNPSSNGHSECFTPAMDETYADITLGQQHDATSTAVVKVLGVLWNYQEDQLMFDVTEIVRLATKMKPTKRNVISIVGRFYDPLGFLAPVIIQFKVLFQKLCELQLEWDEPLPETAAKTWMKLIEGVNINYPVSLPRSYHNGITEEVQHYSLCGFCDASNAAYAAVVYLLAKTSNVTHTRFLACKTRVAPLQAITIPRLELMSALLLARLITSVSSILSSTIECREVHCFTDSTVTEHWIKGTTKEWKPFVRNRVDEILQKTSPDSWHHCAGTSNPADLPTRGLTIMELQVNRLWRHGPEWLKMNFPPVSDESHCPDQLPEECYKELKASDKTHLLVATETEIDHSVGDLIDCAKFASYRRLIRVTAYTIRATKRFKKIQDLENGSLTAEELRDAECRWIKDCQKEVHKEKSLKLELNLFLDDDGLWRCRGRLENASIPYSMKYPILLPRKHNLTSLIIVDAHKKVLHSGVRETLTETRSRFWIVRGRSLVRAILHRCVTCRKHEGRPYATPPPPPLPLSRVQDAPPFTHTGVDFAGPLVIRTGEHGTSEKAWICLFTCYVTRAVHLDLVLNMTAETFLRSLKRFAARRGMPQQIISDNGKTFKAAAKYLKRVFKEEMVQEYCSERGCKWTFNLEKAPWWGGAFERLIQSTKRCLKKILGKAQLTFDELLTSLTEIEAILNSRPISYTTAGDIEEPLTPSHLLIGRRVLTVPDDLGYICDLNDEEYEVNEATLTRRMKHLNNVINHFWKRWKREYLAELRESHRSLLKGARGNPQVDVGDIVIVYDEDLARRFWRMGRVTRLIVGVDQQVRGATVVVANRNGQTTNLNRPLKKLYPLEVSFQNKSVASSVTSQDRPSPNNITSNVELSPEHSDDPNPQNVPNPVSASATPATHRRPRRAAAVRSEERWRELDSDSNDSNSD